jgi:hypothetical protein
MQWPPWLCGLVIPAVFLILLFTVALIGSKAGERATALATLIAGILALGAGYLVYLSAMSSENHTKERERVEEERRKLNLFLKAQHMAYILTQVVPLRLKAAQLMFSVITPDMGSIQGHRPAAELRIPRPRQLDEIWENLSEFTPGAIYEIRLITQCFDSAEEYLKSTELIPDSNKSPLVGYYNSIFDSARVLSILMADTPLIKNYCKPVADKHSLVYGDYNPDYDHWDSVE